MGDRRPDYEHVQQGTKFKKTHESNTCLNELGYDHNNQSKRAVRSGAVWSPVQRNAFDIAEDIVRKMAGLTVVRPPNRYAQTMRRTVDELSQKHEILFKGMSKKLDVTRCNVDAVVLSVLDEVFADGKYNWGRVVTVYAFAGWMGRHCVQNEMEDCVDAVCDTVGLYVANHLSSWIESNGGWDGFEAFFKKTDSAERFLWCGLLCTVVSLGVGALATALIVK